VGTNTVTWNGSIAAGGSVTITITALVKSTVAPGTIVSNQATFAFDADVNGSNESSASTDDPGQPGKADATSFTVAAAVAGIPTLDERALLALGLLLAGLGAWWIRRS